MKRRIIVTLVFVLAIGLCGGLVWFNFFRDKMIHAVLREHAAAACGRDGCRDAGTREWTPGISAIGTARAENGVELAVQISGLVREIRFNANDKVKKGDLLVQIDDQVERADLIDADAAVKLAEANLERATTLKTRGFNTETSYDQAVARTRDGPVSPATHSGGHRPESAESTFPRRYRHFAHQSWPIPAGWDAGRGPFRISIR